MPLFIVISLLLSSCFAGSLSATARSTPDLGLPVVRTSDFVDAPISGPVTAMARTADGTRWIGSNLLAVHHGLEWETIALPSAYAFRGLAPDASGRLWVGAIGAIGFMARDHSRQWQFYSLLPELQKSGAPNPGDIWHVFALGDGALFVTTEWILRWNGQKFDGWRCPGKIRLQAFSRGDAVLIYQAGVGLLRVSATGDPVVEMPEPALPEYPLTWYAELPRNEALLGLGDSAYRQSADGRFIRLPELSTTLRGTLPSSAVRLSEDLVAIGTFKHGVVFSTITGMPIGAVSETSGLGEDSIYSLGAGPQATLWVGLSSGTACIEPPDRVTAYDSRLGFKGAPLEVLNLANTPYALTSKTVFAFSAAGPTSALSPQPRLLDATVVDDNLWVSGFGGLWRKDSSSWNHEYHVSNDVSCLTSLKALPGEVVFLEGYALKTLRAGPHGWAAHSLGIEVADTPLSLIEDQAGHLWISTITSGIYRFAWTSPDANRTPALHLVGHYRNGYGLPAEATRPQLTRLGDRLFAFSANEILELNRAGTAFQPVQELRDFIGVSTTLLPNTDQPTAYWLVHSRLLGAMAPPVLLRVRLGNNLSGTLNWTPIHAAGLDSCKQATRIDFVDSPSESGPALWVADNARLLRIAPRGLAEQSTPPVVKLQHLQNDGLRLSPVAAGQPLPAHVRDLAFYFTAENATADPVVFYQTRLGENEAAWSTPSPQSAREYHGLSSGSQTFSVRAVDRFGRPGPAASYVFTISAPWYRSSVAFVTYGLSAAAAGLGTARWRTRRLQRQNQRLNELVTERTRELELSNTAKSEFLENVSHEIRNPLNGLTGMLELLQRGELKPRERELARSLHACAQSLTRVSEEVLDYSKLEYGYITLRSRPFSVRQLFNDLVDLFGPTAAREGAFLNVGLDDAFVDGFVGDADKISTILCNFVSNALKYAPGSSIELTADTHETEGGMVDLFFEVTDHGPGVPTSEQELVFQKFVRGSAAKKSQVAGAGLGLATCRMLAKAMNGSVGLESPPTGGATFYLRILVTRTTPPPEAPGIIDDDMLTAGHTRALIVEDEPYNQTVLRGVALELGYSPVSATNAPEASAALSAGGFDVIFLDWELPGIKGGEIARDLRSRPDGDKPVVIATTAHDSDEIRGRCAAAGMDGFLLKPYSKERIRAMITAVLAHRKAGTVGLIDAAPAPADGLNLTAFSLYTRGLAEQQTNPRQEYIVAVEKELSLLRVGPTSEKSAATAGAAHRLRALAGLIGAQDLSRIARELETASASNHRRLLEELTTVWDQLKTRLG